MRRALGRCISLCDDEDNKKGLEKESVTTYRTRRTRRGTDDNNISGRSPRCRHYRLVSQNLRQKLCEATYMTPSENMLISVTR